MTLIGELNSYVQNKLERSSESIVGFIDTYTGFNVKDKFMFFNTKFNQFME
jgi:hypothetical protein